MATNESTSTAPTIDDAKRVAETCLCEARDLASSVHSLSGLIRDQNNSDSYDYAIALMACADKLSDLIDMALGLPQETAPGASAP